MITTVVGNNSVRKIYDRAVARFPIKSAQFAHCDNMPADPKHDWGKIFTRQCPVAMREARD